MSPRGRTLPRLAAALLASACVGLGALFGGAAGARAQDQTGEVLVVLASEQPGVVDANLAQEPALRQPPFNTFRTMRLLERHPVRVSTTRPMVVALPNGRNLQIALVRMLPNGRLQVRVSINRPDKNDYLQGVVVETSPGVPFFIAGQAYQGGTLVIGVRVGLRMPPGVRVGPIVPRPVGPGAFGLPRYAPPPNGAQVVPPPQGAVRVVPPPPNGVQVVPPPQGGVRVVPPVQGTVRVNVRPPT